MSAINKSTHIHTVRKTVRDHIESKKEKGEVSRATYNALLRKYNDIVNKYSNPKNKLLALHESLGQFTKEANSKRAVVKQSAAAWEVARNARIHVREAHEQVEEERRQLDAYKKRNSKVLSWEATFYTDERPDRVVGHEYHGVPNRTYYPKFSARAYQARNVNSFYLQRIIPNPIAAQIDFNRMNNIPHMDATEFENQTPFLATFRDANDDYFQDLRDEFQRCRTSDDRIIIVVHDVRLTNYNDVAPVPVDQIPHFDDDVAAVISSKHSFIKFVLPKETIGEDKKALHKVQYASKWIKDNYLPKSCWLTVLLDMWKEPIEKYHKRKPYHMTYESLHRVLRNVRDEDEERRDFNPAGENGYTFDEVFNFFRQDGVFQELGLFIFDENMDVLARWEPKKASCNIAPKILYVISHKRHIYRCNHNLDSLKNKVHEYVKREREDDVYKVPAATFHLKKKEKEFGTEMISTTEDIIRILHDDSRKGDIRLFYDECSCEHLYFGLYEKGIECFSQIVTAGKLDFRNLRLNNVNEKNITVFTYNQEGVTSHHKFNTQERLEHYLQKKNRLETEVFTTTHISKYSQNVLKMLNSYKSGPLVGAFQKIEEETTTIEFDFKKYYTSILDKFQMFMAVNQFDEFVEYQGQPINEYNFYLVKKLVEDFHYPINEYTIIPGCLIIGVENIRIVSVLVVSTVTPFAFSKRIKAVWDDETLTPREKKDLCNSIAGMMNKSQNQNHYSKLHTTMNDAVAFRNEHGGKIRPLAYYGYDCIEYDKNGLNPVDNFWVTYMTKANDINEGFKLMAIMVYETGQKILLDLKTKLESYGLEVLYANTDCLHIRRDMDDLKSTVEKVNRFRSENPELFENANEDTYESIGKLKMKPDATLQPKNLIFRKNASLQFWDEIKTKREVNHITLVDEFDQSEIIGHIKALSTPLLSQGYAGTGKSSAFKKLHQDGEEKVLFVSPFNALCKDIRNDGCDAVTFHKLIGIRPHNESGEVEEHSAVKPFDVTPYTMVVFDEIFLLQTGQLHMVKKYIDTHQNLKFCATGDCAQLKPIESKLTIDDKATYYQEIVYSIFPNVITMSKNKRCTNQADRITMDNLFQDILATEDKNKIIELLIRKYKVKTIKSEDLETKINICSGWAACSSVSNIVLSKTNHSENKYVVGGTIVCRKTMKIKKATVFSNYTYHIKSISDEFFVLTDEDDEIEVPIKLITQHFVLPYARTCHSVQGMTISQPFTIFGLYDKMVGQDWIYTAISRTTDLSNVSICLQSFRPPATLSGSINRRIELHRRDDDAKGRVVVDESEFVDLPWVLKQLEEHVVCKYCKTTLSLETGENDLDCFSIDRLDNHLAHTKANCQIICRRCNHGKK